MELISDQERDNMKLLSLEGEKKRKFERLSAKLAVVDKLVAHVTNPSNAFPYLILALQCFIVACVSLPAEQLSVLQNRVREGLVEGKNLTQSEFNMFFSSYSFPSIFTPLIGGFLIDVVFGIRIGTLMIVCTTAVGSMIIAIAPYAPSFWPYWAMMVGNFIFGATSEVLYVAQNTIIAQYFTGKEVSFAFGLSTAAYYAGATITYNTNENLANWLGSFRGCLWIGGAVGIVSVIIGVIYVWLDRYAVNHNYVSSKPPLNGSVKLKHIKQFKVSYWVLVVVMCIQYSVIYPFYASAPGILEGRWYHDSEEKAGRVASILPFSSMLASPLVGLLVDRVGFRVFAACGALACLLPAFSSMALFHFSPIPAMTVLGIMFSILPSVTTPCVGILVPEEYLATAFGLSASLMNAVLTFMYWLTGKIADSQEDSFELMIFAAWSCVGFCFCLVWLYLDWRTGMRCHHPSAPSDVVTLTEDSQQEKNLRDEETLDEVIQLSAPQDAP